MGDITWLASMGLLGFAAGAVNALAGGGPIIVVAALAAIGLPATTASLTSTVALLPGQVAAVGARRTAGLPVAKLGRWLAIGIPLLGGAAGAALLLATPIAMFARLLPYLIVLATALYAWHSRHPPEARSGAARPGVHLFWWLIPLSVYGGFYGGGNSFLVMALLAAFGLDPRAGADVKNRLILLINLSASAVFLWSGAIAWPVAWPLAIGATLGGIAGVQLLGRVDPRHLRGIVIAIGAGLAAFLILRE